MNFTKSFISLLFMCLAFNCNQQKESINKVMIIPMPSEQEAKSGYFVLENSYHLSANEGVDEAAIFFSDYLESIIPLKLDPNYQNKVEFIKNGNIKNDEGYHLSVSENKITVEAKTEKGAFYAVQTLIQLISSDAKSEGVIKIPCVEIKDQPQFKYRGMHLDVGRHFYSVDFIKKYIDAMAMLKFNTFHWHLTEDQGWRIEIKKYPKLQDIAAYRNETLVGHYNDQSQQFDSQKYGGYYTQEEIKDVVAYAQKRHITIIPEIEMSGHSQAAIAAYPELGCTGQQVEVATKWGVFEEIYCPTEETFAFLENVLDEVIELFPSKYIHIGGDEAPKKRWKDSKFCQELIKEKGLKDENGLQSYFIKRIETYLNSKGRQIIGWDEILEGGLAPNATVMSWRGIEGGVEAAKAGHEVIMTPTSHCYFDYYQSENEDEPLAIGGFIPLEKVYHFNPIPEGLSKEEANYIIGSQGNIWTEYMPTSQQVEYMAFPRIIALSETLWSSQQQKNYDDFVNRLKYFHQRLEDLNINYANHLYEIEGDVISYTSKSESSKIYYQLKTLIKEKTIRYTLDGSLPNSNSTIYESKIPITESCVINASVFDDDKQIGKVFSKHINFHKAVGSKITINKEPHKAYQGSGNWGLINGISGSNSRYGDKEWLGFWGEDIEIEIDFNEPKEIKSIKTRFHNGNGQWIYAPKHIAIRIILENGGVIANKFIPEEGNVNNIKNIFWELSEDKIVKVKKIILMIPNYGTIPEGKQGAGHKAWTFIDEIIVE